MFWDVECAGATPVHERTQHRSTPSRHQKEQKKKPKSIGEAVADMQEQNRALMEKKLEMHSAHQHEKLQHQHEKLQFLIEQSDKQLAFEHRRLDLQFMWMDQQRVELRIREVYLQVELEKLRAKT